MSDFALFIVLFVVPLIVLWAALLIDLVRRTDLSLGRKFLWAGLTLVTAEIGAVIYIAMRPLRYPEDRLTQSADNELADQLLSAAERGDREALEKSRQDALAALA